MKRISPDYYKEFQCIGGSCRHNCCIGWEIDIDADTASFYGSVSGEMGRRLQENIDWDDEPHFRLGEQERCPFLNKDNLCDIILTLGEDHICEICTEHPRFHNELPGRTESGIGLCCEEAGRLILGRKEKVLFLCSGENDSTADSEEDEFIMIRDQAICSMQDRNLPIPERIHRMLELCGAILPDRTVRQWCEFLLELERLDDTWTTVLEFLREQEVSDTTGFDKFMAERQTEYEQLVIYLLYRHLANAFDEIDLASRAAFAAFGYEFLHAAGSAVWTVTGRFSFEDQVELARLFSSEIEYSEENLECILDEMAGEWQD